MSKRIISTKREIFKLQVPLFSSDGQGEAMVYNKDRSLQAFIPITKNLLKFMAGEDKKYVYGWFSDNRINHGDFVLNAPAPWQEW